MRAPPGHDPGVIRDRTEPPLTAPFEKFDQIPLAPTAPNP
jgi:hypothetical protein